MLSGHLDGSRRTIAVMGEIAATGAWALVTARGLEGMQPLGRSWVARLMGHDVEGRLAERLADATASRARMGEDFATALRKCLKPVFDAHPEADMLMIDPRRLRYVAMSFAEMRAISGPAAGPSLEDPFDEIPDLPDEPSS